MPRFAGSLRHMAIQVHAANDTCIRSRTRAARRRAINRVGFRRRVGGDSDERWEYWILPEAWKNEVCKGLDPRRTADLLAGRKFLLGGTERHRAALETIPGEGKRRLYRVSGAILEGGDGEWGVARAGPQIRGAAGRNPWNRSDYGHGIRLVPIRGRDRAILREADVAIADAPDPDMPNVTVRRARRTDPLRC